MEMINWDLLQPQDIEVRVGGKIKGTDNVTMLLYQDSRCTARNLDKQFGQFGWQIDFKVVGEQIYGTLSIWDKDKQQWVSKSDTGDKTNISENKGQSSDILKRCAVRWGFGTELYTAPKIVMPDDGYGNSGYKVTEIKYNNNREITHLVIANRFDKEVFRWSTNTTQHPVQQAVNVAMDVAEEASKVVVVTKEEIENATKFVKRTNSETLENTVNRKSNLNSLKEFCAEKKKDESVDNNQLLKFFNYYSNKDFKGVMNVEKLWEIWQQKN